MKKKYRITGKCKILIAQLLISSIGIGIGCNWGLNAENKKVVMLAQKPVITGVNNMEQSKKVVSVQDNLGNICISSFSTNLGSSSPTRINNIVTCVKAINGKILMPGEVFSFNETVGERTKERGYMNAPAIINKKIQSELGGGICQVSTTLYNAVLLTGIKNIDRTHHSLPSSYVGLGLDATVDWNNIDLKFSNTLNYPICIAGSVQDKNLCIKIFSNSSLNKKYVIQNNISEQGDMYTADVIRKTYENGKVTNIEHISSDVYVSSNSGTNDKY